MAHIVSNLPEVRALITELRHVIDFDRKGLGHDLADLIAAGIQTRTIDQLSPGGGAIPANRGRYGIRKQARSILVGVGLYGEAIGGEMLELIEIRGQVAIGAKEMVMSQGLTDAVKQKGEWFTEGNSATGQPPREWYELDGEIEAAIGDRLEEAAIDGIIDLGGSF